MAFSIVGIHSSVVRLTIEGALDTATISALRRELSNLIRIRTTRVEMDLSGMRFIDSAGVALLLSFFRSLQARGGVLILHGVRDTRTAILKVLRTQRILAGSKPPN